jgi:hypothetical protein
VCPRHAFRQVTCVFCRPVPRLYKETSLKGQKSNEEGQGVTKLSRSTEESRGLKSVVVEGRLSVWPYMCWITAKLGVSNLVGLS